MNRAAVQAVAHELLAGRKPNAQRESGYLLHHGRRVAALAESLAKAIGEPLDVAGDVLYAGALLHDAGKGMARHAERGAMLVRDALAGAEAGNAAEIDAAAELVRLHCRRGEPCGVAAKVVQDADALDHFGAQNVWLTISYSASMDRSPTEALAYHRSDAEKTHRDRRRASLNFESSREAFEQRVGIEDRFFSRFAAETDGAP
jgi:HD superfamily phosphodiesterase